MLDLITTAIIGAIAKLSEPVVKDAYEGLKNLLTSKLGPSAALPSAVQAMQDNPDSDARKAVLQEEISKAKVEQDDEVVQAAQKVIQQVERVLGGQETIRQIINGNYNVVAGGDIKIGGNYTVGH